MHKLNRLDRVDAATLIRNDGRLNAIRRRLATKTFNCYVCGKEGTTFAILPTVPPDPTAIFRLEDLKRVETCNSNYCLAMEMKRQDAIAQTILAPQRDRYYQERADEAEARRGKK